VAAVARQLRDVGCVFAEEEAQLLLAVATTSADLAAMVTERATGTPLEHVVGWAEFCGLRVVWPPASSSLGAEPSSSPRKPLRWRVGAPWSSTCAPARVPSARR
jgi:hypothetical protein